MNESTASMGMMILWMVVIFGVMYFLMIRPQKKEQKRLQAMLNSMEVGDSIVTTGGFYGVIIDMTEEDVIVEFGNNKNCRIPMRKRYRINLFIPDISLSSPLPCLVT